MSRSRWGLTLLAGLGLLGGGLWLVTPRPVALVRPGITESLATMVQVRQGQAAAAANLRMVAATVEQPTGWQRVLAWGQPAVTVTSLAHVLSDLPFAQYWAAMQGQMWLAQRNAAVVGERLAGRASTMTPQPGVEVIATLAHPAALLPLGTRITALNGHPIASVAQLAQGITAAATPWVTMTVADLPRPLRVRRTAMLLQPWTIAGWVFAPAARVQLPQAVHIARDGIAGSSGGLMFALAVAAESSHRVLDPGHLVTGTGAITAAGTVLPVLDVPQKVVTVARAGASVFFVPAAEAALARATAHRFGDRHLQIVPVHTVAQAYHWLTTRPRA